MPRVQVYKYRGCVYIREREAIRSSRDERFGTTGVRASRRRQVGQRRSCVRERERERGVEPPYNRRSQQQSTRNEPASQRARLRAQPRMPFSLPPSLALYTVYYPACLCCVFAAYIYLQPVYYIDLPLESERGRERGSLFAALCGFCFFFVKNNAPFFFDFVVEIFGIFGELIAWLPGRWREGRDAAAARPVCDFRR